MKKRTVTVIIIGTALAVVALAVTTCFLNNVLGNYSFENIFKQDEAVSYIEVKNISGKRKSNGFIKINSREKERLFCFLGTASYKRQIYGFEKIKLPYGLIKMYSRDSKEIYNIVCYDRLLSINGDDFYISEESSRAIKHICKTAGKHRGRI